MIGAGPGGYSAAFRAADLGKKVVLVDKGADARRRLPQRRLHSVEGAAACGQGDRRDQEMSDHGIAFAAPSLDIDKLRGWKDSIIKKLTGGLSGLAKQRKVTVVTGVGTFLSPKSVLVEDRRWRTRRSRSIRRSLPAAPNR